MLPLRITGVLISLILLAGCGREEAQKLNYDMGERVSIGPLTYVVVESAWRTQLGELFQIRVPQQRFFMITLSVTNGGGSDVSIPLLNLEGPNGQLYQELEDGTGVSNWFGLFRTITPAQTQQGRILFDVPLTSFRLRVPDANDAGYEKFVSVEIPLRIDADQIQTPVPGADLLK
jgi:hypothetical protein